MRCPTSLRQHTPLQLFEDVQQERKGVMGGCSVASRYKTTAKRLPSGDTAVQVRIEGIVDFAYAPCADAPQNLVSTEFRVAT
jgi:hypothetical protein